MKGLERTPASLPLPDPSRILLGVSWLSGLDSQGLETVQSATKLECFQHQEIILERGSRTKGLYVILSGLVKVHTTEYSTQCSVDIVYD